MANAWPSSTDYNEAVQNPALNFADPDLKSATAALFLLAVGLPTVFVVSPCCDGFQKILIAGFHWPEASLGGWLQCWTNSKANHGSPLLCLPLERFCPDV